MSEYSAWASLRDHLARPGLHIQRIESSTGNGIPDTNLCYKGRELWLEGKHLKALPTRASTPIKIGIRAEQEVWIKRRITAGGTVFVWCRFPGSWWLFEGVFAEELRAGVILGDLQRYGKRFNVCATMAKAILLPLGNI